MQGVAGAILPAAPNLFETWLFETWARVEPRRPVRLPPEPAASPALLTKGRVAHLMPG